MPQTEDLSNGTLEIYSPEEVHEGMKAGRILLIDVRTPMEFGWEHIHGALLSPMSGFDPEYLPTDTDRKIVFHCGSGVRSKSVSEKCMEAGWKTVAHMEGGMTGWKKAKLPYVGVNPSTGAPKAMNT